MLRIYQHIAEFDVHTIMIWN